MLEVRNNWRQKFSMHKKSRVILNYTKRRFFSIRLKCSMQKDVPTEIPHSTYPTTYKSWNSPHVWYPSTLNLATLVPTMPTYPTTYKIWNSPQVWYPSTVPTMCPSCAASLQNGSDKIHLFKKVCVCRVSCSSSRVWRSRGRLNISRSRGGGRCAAGHLPALPLELHDLPVWSGHHLLQLTYVSVQLEESIGTGQTKTGIEADQNPHPIFVVLLVLTKFDERQAEVFWRLKRRKKLSKFTKADCSLMQLE